MDCYYNSSDYSLYIIYDKPQLNVVYVPQMFQSYREMFTDDYIFTVPINENIHFSQNIPYKEMKPPIIYISLGSIISNRGFCKMIIRAFRNKDMSVILNTGRIKPETLRNIPDNIYAYSFVPQNDVLKNASVFLTHCGMNSVNEAITYGVPMVAMPFINDQLSNAKRIVELGIGERVRSFPGSGRQIYKAIIKVYNNEHIRNRSIELSSLLKKENTLDDVITRVENICTI